jgi:predicted restriction endonuclease
VKVGWHQAVISALERYAETNATIKIERSQFLAQQLSRIVTDTSSIGKTPAQTVSRVLQELRKEGYLFFSDAGLYTLNRVQIKASVEDLPDDVLDNAIQAGRLELSDVETASDVAIVRVRRGVQMLRKHTLLNYRCACALCDVSDANLLVASHIARWADNPKARGLLANTICFCTLHDKLFESGYFSMTAELNLIWKSPLSSEAIKIWQKQCTTKFKIPQSIAPAATYIHEHRSRVGL